MKTMGLAPKLTEQHIKLPPFSPMRVCLALQTLSHSVSSEIMTLVALNKLDPKSVNTTMFRKLIDNLFDVFNSILLNETKQLRRPLTIDSSEHWKILKEAHKIFKNLKICNSKNRQSPCITGWIGNIIGLEFLFFDLKDNLEF